MELEYINSIDINHGECHMFGRNRLAPTFNNDGTVTLSGPCIVTKKEYSVTVPEVGYRQWATGNALIQKALPSVSKDDREFLISGTSPEGWNAMFGEDEDA